MEHENTYVIEIFSKIPWEPKGTDGFGRLGRGGRPS